MNIDTVIAQIRAGAPIFNGNVAGAAAWANGVADQVWLPRPACYVVPIDMEAGPQTSLTGLTQIVTIRSGVIIDIDNSLDRRGQASSAQVTDFWYAVCRAILNWRPDWPPATVATNPVGDSENTASRGFFFLSGETILMDRARLQYQFTFGLEVLLSDYDGWQPPSGPLDLITSTVPGDTPATQPIVFNAGP